MLTLHCVQLTITLGMDAKTGQPGPASVKKCMNMTLCCANSPAPCVILPEEVQALPLGGLLVPDVQVFEIGHWSPTPAGTIPNGMSMGFGFTSIKAKFQLADCGVFGK